MLHIMRLPPGEEVCICPLMEVKKVLLTRWFPCAANVDEVFIDLCRQIIRRDNAGVLMRDESDNYPYNRKPSYGAMNAEKGSGRTRRKNKKPRCTILWMPLKKLSCGWVLLSWRWLRGDTFLSCWKLLFEAKLGRNFLVRRSLTHLMDGVDR